MKPIFILLGAAALVACSTTTDAVKVGPDTYSTSAHGCGPCGGASKAQELVLTQAAAQCQKLNRELLVKSIQVVTNDATVIFRCLSAGDPELQRPNIELTPNAVIEDKRK